MMPSEDKQKLFERMHEQLGRRVPEIPKEFEDPQIDFDVWFLRRDLLAPFSACCLVMGPYLAIANGAAINSRPAPQGPLPNASLDQDEVAFVMLSVLAWGIVLLVLWQLWRYLSPASLGRKGGNLDLLRAQRAISVAWALGVTKAVGTLCLVLYSNSFAPVYGTGFEGLFDVAIVLGLSFGIYKRSRFCAVSLVAYQVLVVLFYWSQGIRPHLGFLAPLIVCFVYGMRGTFAYHRLAKQKAPSLPGSSPSTIAAVSPEIPNDTAPGSETTPVCGYFILRNEESEGPYSIEELQSLWGSGEITRETFYCEEGYEEWLRLEKIADQLQSATSVLPDPLPPAQNAARTSAAPEPEGPPEPSIPDVASKNASRASGRGWLADGIADWGLGLLMLGGLGLLLSYSHLLTVVCGVGFGVLLVLGLPLAFLKPTRRFVGYGLFGWGWLAVLDLVSQSFSTVSLLWGRAAAIVGVCLGIVGVIPEALLASLVKGEWGMAFWLLVYVILVHAAFFGGLALAYEDASGRAGGGHATENSVSAGPPVERVSSAEVPPSKLAWMSPHVWGLGLFTAAGIVTLLGFIGLALWQMNKDGRGKTPNKAADPHEVGRLLKDADVELTPDPNVAATNRLTSLQALAEKGDAGAQYSLGYCYYLGQGVTNDTVEAVRWFRKAAEQGVARAQFYLGYCYWTDSGGIKNKAEGVKWIRKAVEQGDDGAQRILGMMYAEGDGVPQDEEEAMKWLRKAFEKGENAEDEAKTYYHLGTMCEVSDRKDLARAMRWYLRASEKGEGYASYRIGQSYYAGDGVAKNIAEALKWYHKAAEQGAPDAQYCLGGMYQVGKDVRQNYVEAAKWLRRAAEQEALVADMAQFSLALLYEYGNGVPKSYVEAYKWLILSAAQDTDVTKRRMLASLEDKMTREQIAEGQRLAREFKPR